jgi:hypothetical protein
MANSTDRPLHRFEEKLAWQSKQNEKDEKANDK